MAMSLLPLARADLKAQINPTFYTVDSSLSHYCVCRAHASVDDVRQAYVWKEKARFKPSANRKPLPRIDEHSLLQDEHVVSVSLGLQSSLDDRLGSWLKGGYGPTPACHLPGVS